MCRADHSYRGVIRPVNVIAKPPRVRPRSGIGSKRDRNIYIYIYIYTLWWADHLSRKVLSNFMCLNKCDRGTS